MGCTICCQPDLDRKRPEERKMSKKERFRPRKGAGNLRQGKEAGESGSGLEQGIVRDEIVEAGFLLLGQFAELEAETMEVRGDKRAPGMGFLDADQAYRDVLQIEIFVFQEDIKGQVLGRDIVIQGRLEFHASRADIQDGKGNIIDEGKCSLADLKSWILPPLSVSSHIHHLCVDPSCCLLLANSASLLLNSWQYSTTSSRRCETLRRK